ncbi:enoyl-CoA hydratase/isomerase family protein [Nocardia salmonicida]|uniref:enoyl-CoA hydratase/isomerase family protein n=1 Tax=Nocardia salmonicida TaxID=53431 RepID=UPI0036588D89
MTLSNPPANLFDGELTYALLDAVRRATDNGARAMVIQADGAVFSGGADVAQFVGKSAADARVFLGEAMRLMSELENAPFPVIAAVHGLCLAAGLELALACDLVVAADSTQFSQVEATIGAATFLGGAYRLAERCGPARAREIVFGAGFHDAQTFEKWNIVNRVVAADQLRIEALAWATQLAKGPTAAHAVTKRLVRYGLDHGSQQADRYALDVATPLFERDDMRSAVGKLLESGARRYMQNRAEITFEGR